jgi:hypothetical protein
LAPVPFDLKETVKEATAKLVKTFPDAQDYLVSLCDQQLEGKLTPGEVGKLATELLEKAGFVEVIP